jgi:membrane protease YdiL (CAAX protease family)
MEESILKKTRESGPQHLLVLKVTTFILLVLAFAFLGPVLGGKPSNPGPGFVLWGIAPALAAIILRLVTRDWKDAGFRPNFKRSWRLWLLVILVVPGLMVLNTILGVFSGAASVRDYDLIKYLSMVLPGLGVFTVFAVFEETGWRGYLVPKLAALGLNDFISYLILGLVWFIWHLPFITDLTWIYNPGDYTLFISLFFTNLIAYSVVYYEIRLASESVWPVVLLHALTNAIQHPMAEGFIKVKPGMEFLAWFTGVFMTVMLILLGLLLRWRRIKVGNEIPRAALSE